VAAGGDANGRRIDATRRQTAALDVVSARHEGLAYRRWMDPVERFHRTTRETLELGSPRGLNEKLHPALRRRGAVLVSVAVGVVVGAGAVLGWNDQYGDRPSAEQRVASAAAKTQVSLVLGGVSPGTPRNRFLSIDAVLLHDRGPGSATVRRIHRPGTSLSIRVPDLPVTLTANHPYERVLVRLAPRDCALATEWTPSARPLTLTWEDEHGISRSGIGGDHDAPLELSLIQHMNAVCGDAFEH
jgi:hypothetical protein